MSLSLPHRHRYHYHQRHLTHIIIKLSIASSLSISLSLSLSYLGGLDGLNLPRARDELDRLGRMVGDLHFVDEDVLVLKRVALLRVILATNLNPIPHTQAQKERDGQKYYCFISLLPAAFQRHT